MNMNLIREKKRVARIGKLSNDYTEEESKLAPDDYVLDILKAMDDSHSKKKIISYQQLQELRSQKEALNANAAGPTSKACSANERYLQNKQAKKILPEKTFPLMAKCQKSLSYLKNRCIPKPRAHVGFVAKPVLQPVPIVKSTVLQQTLRIPTKTQTPELGEKKAEKVCVKKSKAPKKVALKKKPRKSNLTSELPTAEEKKIISSDSDSDFENFLKVHHHVPKTSDESSSDIDLKTSKRTRQKNKTKKFKRNQECAKVKENSLTEEAENPFKTKSQETVKRKHSKISRKGLSKVLPESDDSNFLECNPQKKKRIKRKPEKRLISLNKVTSIPLSASDDSLDFTESTAKEDFTKDKSKKQLNINSASDIDEAVWGFSDHNSSECEGVDLDSRLINNMQNSCKAPDSESSNFTTQKTKARKPSSSSDQESNSNAHCFVLLKKDVTINSMALDSNLKNSNLRNVNTAQKDKIFGQTEVVNCEVNSERKPGASKLCSLTVTTSKKPSFIDDLPSTDPDDDCVFVCENIKKSLNHEKLQTKADCESRLMSLSENKNTLSQQDVTRNNVQMSELKNDQASFVCGKSLPTTLSPNSIPKPKFENGSSETEECIFIYETPQSQHVMPSEKDNNPRTSSQKSEILPVTSLPSENCPSPQLTYDEPDFEENDDAPFNLQIVSVESLSEKKEIFDSLGAVVENIEPKADLTLLQKSKQNDSEDSDIEIVPVDTIASNNRQTEISDTAEIVKSLSEKENNNSSKTMLDLKFNNPVKVTDDDCLILDEKVASKFSNTNSSNIPVNKLPSLETSCLSHIEKFDSSLKPNQDGTVNNEQSLNCEKECASLHTAIQSCGNKEFNTKSKDIPEIPNACENDGNVLSNFVPDPKIFEILNQIDFECIKKVINGTSLKDPKAGISVSSAQQTLRESEQVSNESDELHLNLQLDNIEKDNINSSTASLKEGYQSNAQEDSNSSSCTDMKPKVAEFRLQEKASCATQKDILITGQIETIPMQEIKVPADVPVEDATTNNSNCTNTVQSGILCNDFVVPQHPIEKSFKKANLCHDSNRDISPSLVGKVKTTEVPVSSTLVSTSSVTSSTANTSCYVIPDELPESNISNLVSKSHKNAVDTYKNNSFKVENKICSLIKQEKDFEMKNQFESMSDELDMTATSLISTLEIQRDKTIIPLLDLYKAEYKKYREIRCTEKNVSAGLRLLQEKQEKKLSHIGSSIKNLVKRDPCLYRVASQMKHSRSRKDVKNLVKEESKVPLALENVARNMPIKMENDCSSATKVNPTAQVYSRTNLKCAECGKPATGLCLGCKQVYYCSTNCGEISWNRGHSQACQGGC